ncbi:uncharacterized protein LOC141899985 isoform X3 [Tubulanus polymorphus]|uniref:uncharacterized protein LOC141899985 isoform X3 n=1 Tax=Tubulanus polymorphus TaxID=672921 RepID=UPI003DA5164E
MSCFLQEEGQDDDVSSEDNIITQLFNDGFTNKEICHSLETYFGLAMSERTLKRRLNKLGLKRRCNYQLHEVVSVVEEEVRGSGSCLGYRAMTSRLRNRYGIRVPRTVVSGVQRLIDPEGVRERASGILRRRNYSAKGPNYLIHVDGHDKLKPYGFAIHGAIDGYSRRILWLNVSNTNNDPAVIGWYFVDFIEQIKAVPRCVRIDAGTENGILASIQEAFLTDHTNEASVVIGRSTSNQRIERWWRTLRHSLGQYWMNLFKDMADRGLFSNADPIHIVTWKYRVVNLIYCTSLQRCLEQMITKWPLIREYWIKYAGIFAKSQIKLEGVIHNFPRYVMEFSRKAILEDFLQPRSKLATCMIGYYLSLDKCVKCILYTC